MSEQEIKQQIERDAESFFNEFGFLGSETRARIQGAKDQDKIATNRTVEEALGIAHALIEDKITWNKVIKELEKLRRV